MNDLSRIIKPSTLILLVLLLMLPLTACDKTSETTNPPNESCSYNIQIEISNDSEQIEMEYVNCLAYGTDKDNQFTADGICQIYDMVANKDDLPVIDQTENMDLIKVMSVSISKIEVYNIDGTLLETWNTWDERTTMSAGQYFVKLTVSNQEDHCNVSGHNIFVLNVN